MRRSVDISDIAQVKIFKRSSAWQKREENMVQDWFILNEPGKREENGQNIEVALVHFCKARAKRQIFFPGVSEFEQRRQTLKLLDRYTE